jgi:phosphoserine phosphatase
MATSTYFIGDVYSTKDKIIKILADSNDSSITIKKILFLLKKEHALSITYQAVHKLLNQLLIEKIVIKENKSWNLNPSWINNQLSFFNKISKSNENNKKEIGKTIKVFAFDVNGTLTPEITHVELAKSHTHYNEIKSVITSQTLGKTTIIKAYTKLNKLFKGISLYQIVSYGENFSLMPNLKETLHELKKKGAKIGLVTTGFKVLMDIFNKRLSNVFEFVICNELVFVNNKRKKLSPNKIKEIIARNNKEEMEEVTVSKIKIVIKNEETKTQLLKKYLAENGLTFANACCVGDSMGDADFIKVAAENGGIGIAFNPNLSLLDYANFLKSEGKDVRVVESKDTNELLKLFD